MSSIEPPSGPAHIAFIHTETPGPVKVAICACGWRGNPQITAVAAIKERQAHYEQQRRRPAVQEVESE